MSKALVIIALAEAAWLLCALLVIGAYHAVQFIAWYAGI